MLSDGPYKIRFFGENSHMTIFSYEKITFNSIYYIYNI